MTLKNLGALYKRQGKLKAASALESIASQQGPLQIVCIHSATIWWEFKNCMMCNCIYFIYLFNNQLQKDPKATNTVGYRKIQHVHSTEKYEKTGKWHKSKKKQYKANTFQYSNTVQTEKYEN